MNNPKEIQLPPDDVIWAKNNLRGWPHLVYEDLVEYLIDKEAYDRKAMRAFRSLYGKNYVDSGWIGDIFDYQDNNLHYLKTTVSPSQPGIGRKDYKVWVAVSTPEIFIQTGYCTCPAGWGRSCSHISALLYAIVMAYSHGVAGETCTDKPCLWGKTTSSILSSNNEFNDIVTENHEKKFRSDSDDKVSKPQQFSSHDDLLKHVSNVSVMPLWECKGTLLNKILTAKISAHVDRKPLVHGLHNIDPTKPATPDCEPCREFYNKFVNLDNSQFKILRDNTSEQNSSLWMDSRRVRMTASKVNSIPKTSRADPEKFVNNHIYQRFKGCAATKHGQKYEPVARKWLEEKMGLKISKSGIVIREDEKYLSASPDGIFDENTIVEIKCPTKPLKEYIESGIYDVVLNKNGVPVLNKKGKNGYFVQVQMTMHCTNSNLCKFLVWTQDYQVIIDVPYDKEFVEEILPRVRHFYFTHLLVRLTEENFYGRLQISSEYKKVCS